MRVCVLVACKWRMHAGIQAGTKRKQCTCNVYLSPRPSLLCSFSTFAHTHLFYRRLPFLGLAKGAAVLVQLGQHGFLLLQALLELGLCWWWGWDGPVRTR